jgi:hypothetical protein
MSLADSVRADPKGANYDFTWATEVQALVVSPLVEWIWTRNPEFWITDSIPRIASADEVISYLTRKSHREAKRSKQKLVRSEVHRQRRSYRKK